MKQIHYTELTNAIIIAMEDYMGNNAFTPHDPAILYDGKRRYYGSKLHGDRVLFDLADGFGFYTPEDEDDIPCAADALATAIVNETLTN